MDISKYLKDLRKTTESTNFEESTVGAVREYISTGSYALNRIISGDFFGGIPNNRVIIFGGKSQSGKTLIATMIIANAINLNNFDVIFLFDAEGGSLKNVLKGMGTDLTKIEHIMVKTVEDAAVKIHATYSMIAEIKKDKPNLKALCILDSLGALVTKKVFKDLDAEDPKLDRGLRARTINDMVKSFTVPALLTECGIVLLNHIYENPNANPMYPEKIKPQSGGLGVQYMARLTFQCSQNYTREEKKEDREQGVVYEGTILKVLCLKNNIIVPFLESETEIDFRTGFVSPYSGLLNLAVKYGYIVEQSAKSYIVPSYDKSKKFKEDAILTGKDSAEIWKTFINDLNEAQKKDVQYSSFLNADSAEDIEELPEAKSKEKISMA